MNKGILIIVIICLAFAIPLVSAVSEHSDNSIAGVFHWVSMVAIIAVVIFTFMAAGMFAEGLGKAMKFIGAGMVLIGINSFMEELAHLEVFVIPEGTWHSLVYHGLSGIGLVLLAFGFYRVYSVAKDVSLKKK